jgi:polar amino acid transport system substrate-binding protein
MLRSALTRAELGLFAILAVLTTATAEARDLRVVFSQYTPPYVFENGEGIVVDIVRKALARHGHTVTPLYLPIGRGFLMFAQGKVDGTAIIKRNSGLEAHYSAPFMQYNNHAIGLRSRDLAIDKLSDLADKRIIAFQNAHKYLGEAFGRVAEANPGYQEMGNQKTQVLMLLKGRVDVVIMDEAIFRYYRGELIREGKVPGDRKVELFDLFPATQYRCAFTDPAIRDDFDDGLRRIRADGTYDAIFEHYEAKYFEVER